nr:hypothetical protein YSBCXYJI_YSBCXYJI_CDS_0101 [Caudoviricetes sp.]
MQFKHFTNKTKHHPFHYINVKDGVLILLILNQY